MGCSSLKEVNIHSLSQIETIGEYSFSDCTSLSEVKIPSSVKIIEIGAFRNCSSLRIVSFDHPSSLKTIDLSCFEKCLSLKEIEIPDSVKSIRRFAFKNCEALTDIKIHPSLKIIQPNAFDGCTSLDPNLITSSIQGLKIPKTDKLPIIKFIVLGGFDVGKTTICKRYVNKPIDEVDMGIGTNFMSKVITVDGNEVSLHIYDVPGMERLSHNYKLYYRNVNVAILVIDLTNQKTMDRALDYFLEVKKMNSAFTAIFLCSKSEHGDAEKLKKNERFIELENEYQFKCFDVSAQMNENIDESFQYAANEAFYRFIYDEQILKEYEVDENGKSIDISNQGDSKKRSNC